MNRKEWKQSARKSLKEHYLLYTFICLLIGVLGLEYVASLSTIKAVVKGEKTNTVYERIVDGEIEEDKSLFDKIYDFVVNGEINALKEKAQNNEEELSQIDRKLGIVSIEHSQGVFSKLVNITSSGTIIVVVMEAIKSMVHSGKATMIIVIALSGLFIWLVRIFVLNVLGVAFKRFFMEGRQYENVPVNRFLYLFRLKSWINVALTVLLQLIFHTLWVFTIIGGIIKRFSYFMVPYIVAENPTIKPIEAINLSRRMMDGHKWECFKMSFSFLGWDILDALTFGISGIFFSNPYQEATYAEYYVYVRGCAKEKNIEGIEVLNDTYLYEYADDAALQEAYREALNLTIPEMPVSKRNPVYKFVNNFFGICLKIDEEEKIYEERIVKIEATKGARMVLDKKMYPSRLFTVPEKVKTRRIEHVNYLRHYSVVSVILIFFTFCFIGWSWEVSLHLVEDGVFVNRGVLHGPWLPIYGSGGILILLVLNKLRNNPVVEFFSAIILCGVLEYYSHWWLEITHDGQKWWDYSGYFLNINGRICAEGLLIFGLGGMAIVYIVAPFIDNYFRKIPIKMAVVICVILLAIFAVDQVYSSSHPNMGEGITDYGEHKDDFKTSQVDSIILNELS